MPDLLHLPPPTDVPVSACTGPWALQRTELRVPHGLTLAEIVDLAVPDAVFRAHAVVLIGDERVPAEWWRSVRPKPGTRINIAVLPRSGNTARILGLVGAAILGIVVTIAAGPAGIGMAPYWAAFAGMVATTAATLAVNLLLPAPGPEVTKDKGGDKPTYAISGARNRADPWGKLPVVLGRFRVVPSYAAAPYREVVGGQVYWRALFALGHGPLQIDDMRIGETPIGAYEEVSWDFRRGWGSFNYRGSWNPNSGAMPAVQGWEAPIDGGDTWTVAASGSVAGVGFLAGQTITYHGLGPTDHPGSWDVDHDKPIGLYPSDAVEENLSIALTAAAGPQVRTTVVDTDQVGVEIVFEQGLYHVQNSPPGKVSDNRVTLRIEQAPTGTQAWAHVTTQTVVDRRRVPVYWGWTWNTADYGNPHVNRQYDIRVTRISGDGDERNVGAATWFSLKSFGFRYPAPTTGVALLAVRVRASGQLQGVIDQINCVAQSLCRTWDPALGRWRWMASSNPAALYRHLLQHPGRVAPATDAQIDLERLRYWHTRCQQQGFAVAGVIEAKQSLWDVLVKVCRIGRASPLMRDRDLAWSVVIDEPRGAPVRLFTPRNSWAYEGEMSHEPAPHGYRVGFINKDRDWQVDEVVVYDDGYGPTTATRLERIEWIGVADRQQAWREGRYHLAQQRIRREVHRLTVDFEHLACERGDLVALQHDVIAVGIGSARVAEVIAEGGVAARLRLDAAIRYTTGSGLGVRARRIVGGAHRTDLYPAELALDAQGFDAVGDVDQLDNWDTAPEWLESDTLLLTARPALADAPAPGDLVAVGRWDRESLRVIVRDIEPRNDLTARLTLIAEGPGVHTAEYGAIVPYDPVVTPPLVVPPPAVIGIRSDATVMLVTGARELVTRVVFRLRPIALAGTAIAVLYRLTGTSGAWIEATVQEETPATLAITGVQSGETYDFRLIRTHPNHFASSAASVVGYRVIGRADPPAPLQNLSLSIVGGQALLRWDLPADLDVQIGGWIVFRHTPEEAAPAWSHSTSLGRTINGDQTHVYLPLKPGTYLGKTYDVDGREAAAAAMVATKQASVLAFTPVAELVEDPAFLGPKTNCTVESGSLTLTEAAFDAVPDVDAEQDFDSIGASVAAWGVYQFAAGMDFGVVRRVRLTSRVYLEAVNAFDLVDARGEIDTWPDVDGTLGANVDAIVWGRLTDDDPASPSAVWTPYQRIDAVEVAARGVGHLECRMTTDQRTYNLLISQLRLKAEAMA